MTQRQKVLEEAMAWKGAAYHDRAAVPYLVCDCATFPLMCFSRAGCFEWDGTLPYWSPQDWLHNPDEHKYMDQVEKFGFREITEAEAKPGDLVVYRVCHSWTHGAIIIEWPRYVLHPIKELGVIGSHGTEEGFLRRRPHRFFTCIGDGS